MTVYAITVDGMFEHLADLDDPQPWVEAARQVEHALAGRERHIEAVAQKHLYCDVNPMVWFGAKMMLDG